VIMDISKFDIPKKSISYLVVCAGIILVICLLGIFPLYHYNSGIAADIEKINSQVKDHENLNPLYVSLRKTLEQKESLVLPLPKRTKISREQAGKFNEEFKVIASKSGMMIVSLIPDYTTSAVYPDNLFYNAVVRGEFINFRKMLINLGSVPYLDRIDALQAQRYADMIEYRFRISLETGK
jgi:hypothetical protein